MQNRFRTLIAVLIAGAVFLVAGAAWAGTPKGAADKQDVLWPADKIAWEDGPAKGTHVAKLWGDMMKGGSYGVLIRFDAGVMHPLHWHTSSLKVVVLSGTFVHHAEGGSEVRLGPGSYLLQAGGRKHISGASPEGPCTFFMTSAGKFDMKMAEDTAKK